MKTHGDITLSEQAWKEINDLHPPMPAIEHMKIWKCTACAGSKAGCQYTNTDNPLFVPTMCPGDGGLALWTICMEYTP